MFPPMRQTALQSRLTAGTDSPSHEGRNVSAARFLSAGTIMAAALLSGQGVQAQTLGDEVLLPTDIFDAPGGEGLRISPGFILRPQIDVTGQYDSNIYNLPNGEIDDWVAVIQPAVTLVTDLQRHALQVHADAQIRRYADTSAENSEQYQIDGTTRLDLGSRMAVHTKVGAARRIEQRGTTGDTFATDSPIEFTEVWAGFQGSRTGGKLEILADANARRTDYSQATVGGLPLSLNFRNARMLDGAVTTRYQIGTGTKATVRVGLNDVKYLVDTGTPRDSWGYSALAGIQYEVSSLIDVEIAAGYVHQEFEDPTIDSVNGIDYLVSIDWTPKPQYLVTLEGRRNVVASPLNDAPVIIRSNFALTGQAAATDRILLDAAITFTHEDYSGADRADRFYFVGGGVSYRLTENVTARTMAGWRKRDSDVLAAEYDGFAIGLGLSLAI